MKVTAIFDIGKTNKKCFLFDENLQVVHQESVQLEETVDEDDFPTENLNRLVDWVKSIFNKLLNNKSFEIQAVNFSTYGASLVHIDHSGKPMTPLYNYLKPLSPEILDSFYRKYGPELQFAAETASPPLAMLNSGLQLYWLKYARPEIFNKIKRSFHFPQYLSYLFSGTESSDYTSIGCHTALWNFSKKDYHRWVYEESIDKKLPPVKTDPFVWKQLDGKNIKIGVGIHDSSAALLPYLKADKEPFALISTGTWSISLNPFNNALLDEKDLTHDCLNFMQVNGKPAKAARLFLGKEYEWQVSQLNNFYQKSPDYHRNITFDEQIYLRQYKDKESKFHLKHIRLPRQQPRTSLLSKFRNFEAAYHRMMIELMNLQLDSLLRAIGNTPVKKIYIDGGFVENDVFLQLAKRCLTQFEVLAARSPIGSALGAALMVADHAIDGDFLEKHYQLARF